MEIQMTGEYPNYDIWNAAWLRAKEEQTEPDDLGIKDWLDSLEEEDDEELRRHIQGIIDAAYKVNRAQDNYEAWLEEQAEDYWYNYKEYWGLSRSDDEDP
jgi:hypothetical protein